MTWIKCADQMPLDNTAVIVCCAETDDNEGPFVASGFHVGPRYPAHGWQSQDSFQGDKPIPWPVTHWMPLPEPPK